MRKDKAKRLRRMENTRRVVRRRLKIWRYVWKVDERYYDDPDSFFKPGRLRKNNLAQCSCAMCKKPRKKQKGWHKAETMCERHWVYRKKA